MPRSRLVLLRYHRSSFPSDFGPMGPVDKRPMGDALRRGMGGSGKYDGRSEPPHRDPRALHPGSGRRHVAKRKVGMFPRRGLLDPPVPTRRLVRRDRQVVRKRGPLAARRGRGPAVGRASSASQARDCRRWAACIAQDRNQGCFGQDMRLGGRVGRAGQLAVAAREWIRGHGGVLYTTALPTTSCHRYAWTMDEDIYPRKLTTTTASIPLRDSWT